MKLAIVGLGLLTAVHATYIIDDSCDNYDDILSEGLDGAFDLAQAASDVFNNIDPAGSGPIWESQKDLISYLFPSALKNGNIDKTAADWVRAEGNFGSILLFNRKQDPPTKTPKYSGIGFDKLVVYCDLKRMKEDQNCAGNEKKGWMCDTSTGLTIQMSDKYKDCKGKGIFSDTSVQAYTTTYHKYIREGHPPQLQLCPSYLNELKSNKVNSLKDQGVKGSLSRGWKKFKAWADDPLRTPADVAMTLDSTLLHELSHAMPFSDVIPPDGKAEPYGWKDCSKLQADSITNADNYALFGLGARLISPHSGGKAQRLMKDGSIKIIETTTNPPPPKLLVRQAVPYVNVTAGGTVYIPMPSSFTTSTRSSTSVGQSSNVGYSSSVGKSSSVGQSSSTGPASSTGQSSSAGKSSSVGKPSSSGQSSSAAQSTSVGQSSSTGQASTAGKSSSVGQSSSAGQSPSASSLSGGKNSTSTGVSASSPTSKTGPTSNSATITASPPQSTTGASSGVKSTSGGTNPTSNGGSTPTASRTSGNGTTSKATSHVSSKSKSYTPIPITSAITTTSNGRPVTMTTIITPPLPPLGTITIGSSTKVAPITVITVTKDKTTTPVTYMSTHTSSGDIKPTGAWVCTGPLCDPKGGCIVPLFCAGKGGSGESWGLCCGWTPPGSSGGGPPAPGGPKPGPPGRDNNNNDDNNNNNDDDNDDDDDDDDNDDNNNNDDNKSNSGGPTGSASSARSSGSSSTTSSCSTATTSACITSVVVFTASGATTATSSSTTFSCKTIAACSASITGSATTSTQAGEITPLVIGDNFLKFDSKAGEKWYSIQQAVLSKAMADNTEPYLTWTHGQPDPADPTSEGESSTMKPVNSTTSTAKNTSPSIIASTTKPANSTSTAKNTNPSSVPPSPAPSTQQKTTTAQPPPSTSKPAPTSSSAPPPPPPQTSSPPDMSSPACKSCTNKLGASDCRASDTLCLANQCKGDKDCQACKIDCNQWSSLSPP